jgi:hypothetical protein
VSVPPVAVEDDDLRRIELLDHVGRMRRDDGLPHRGQHKACDTLLRMRRQRDLRLLHCEDHRLFVLQLSDEGQQREDQ